MYFMNKSEEIKDKEGNIVAIIIPKDFKVEGTSFFTPDDFSQQLGFISRKKGETIKAHTHKAIDVTIQRTQETIFIRKGSVQVDLYDTEGELVESKKLEAGDVISLVSGGHGFTATDDLEMIEVKQGPNMGDSYKIFYDSSK